MLKRIVWVIWMGVFCCDGGGCGGGEGPKHRGVFRGCRGRNGSCVIVYCGNSGP